MNAYYLARNGLFGESDINTVSLFKVQFRSRGPFIGQSLITAIHSVCAVLVFSFSL